MESKHGPTTLNKFSILILATAAAIIGLELAPQTSLADNPAFLSYDFTQGRTRTAAEEWAPHHKQSPVSIEWWYITCVVHDVHGNKYLLYSALNRFSGDVFNALLPPGSPPPNATQSIQQVQLSFSDYQNNFNIDASSPTVVASDSNIWNANTGTVAYNHPTVRTSWRYNGNGLALSSQSSKLSFKFVLGNGNQVMWNQDNLGIPGVIQQGPPGQLSFYYSLPRTPLVGEIKYADPNGVNKTLWVSGEAWIDRQWGDFAGGSFEWASFRLNSGARLNLYKFDSGHQMGTYQKANGQTQWFDNFVVTRNGYGEFNGSVFPYGWTYDLPLAIEGSQRFTVEPYSPMDAHQIGSVVLYEGAGDVINDATGQKVGVSVNESFGTPAP